MSKKQKSTTNTNQTVTATPTNPEWVTGGVQNLQTRIGGLLDTDASTLVPGASALQTKAFDQAGDLGGWRTGNTAAQGAATGLLDSPMTAQQASAGSLLDADLGGYMNPYLDSVVDTSLAGFDETAGMNRAQLAAAQARGQKFSGSGSAIERALFERGSNQDRTGIEAGLRSGGYDRATSLATGDLDRAASVSQFNAGQANSMSQAERQAQLQAAGLLGDLSNAGAANDRADLGLLSDLGGQEREIDRQKLGAEANLLSLISALQGQQPYDLFRGQNTNAVGVSKTKGKEYGLGNSLDVVGNLLQGAGQGAQGFAALAALSDKRLKTGIKTVGKDGAGRRVVNFRYKGEPKDVVRTGHIAQEVEKTDPHAVFKGPGGYRMINYGLLEGV